MCGIFGYVGKTTNVGKMVLDGLKLLEYRGYDSWGIAVKYQISNIKYPIDEKNFLSTLESTTSAKKLTEIVTACKTGTAEFGSPENKTHAWFTIFAPAYDPEISITVLVEEGGEGSSVAAPIAKKMLEEWFSRN